MEKLYANWLKKTTATLAANMLVMLLGITMQVKAQTNPAAFNLSTGNFSFTSQTASNTTYPTNMQGWPTSANNISTAETTAPGSGDLTMIANGTNTTSGLSNLGANGFQFISTSSGSGATSNKRVGEICVALNTTGRINVLVTWTASDQQSGSPYFQMGLALQYRIGTSGTFTTVSGTTYQSAASSQAAAQTFTNIALPVACENQAVVQIRWIYYQIGSSGSSGRDPIRLDDITVASSAIPACSGAPIAGTAGTTPQSKCSGATATMTVSGYSSGVTGITLQWQQSADGSTGWANVTGGTGATTASYTTAALSTTTFYRCAVTCSNGPTTSATNNVEIDVATPSITSVTNGIRCGIGTVALGATGSGTLHWYAASTGGASLGTGTSFTTPSISATTTYYVEPSSGGSNFNVGLASDVPGNLFSYSTYGMYFSSANAVTINSVDIYPSTAGTLTVTMNNSSGTIIDSRSFTISSGDISTTVKKTLPLGFSVPAASTGWTLNYDIAIYRGEGTYTYPSTSNGFSITGNTLDGNNISSGTRYYLYNWSVSSACLGTRSAVIATVNPAPAITTSATPATICAGNSTNLAVSSSNGSYTYTWSAGTSPSTGASVSASPAFTTTYTVSASDNTSGTYSGCVAITTVGVSVSVAPSAVTITPPSATICAGIVQPLAANGGTVGGNYTFGTATTTNTTTGYPSPYTNYYGGTKHQMLILASELTAAGITAGTPINSISFSVAAVGSTFTGSLSNFQISMKNASSNTLGSTFKTALTLVYGPLTQAIPTTGLPATVTHNITPFVWDGTNNLLIETSYSNGNSGTTNDNVQMRYSDPGFASTAYYYADNTSAANILAATTATSTSNIRPNIILGVSVPTTMTWSPISGLYSNPGGTISYTGTNLTTVYAKPTAGITTVYTVTATGSTGCTKTGTSAITVNTLSTTPSITGNTNPCPGESTTLTASGGVEGTFETTNWFTGLCDNAFTEEWFTQPYVLNNTYVNSDIGGILNINSTDINPRIQMYSIGSFDPAIYKYIQIRYRVISVPFPPNDNAGNLSIYYINTLHSSPDPSQVVSSVINYDGDWHILNLDMTSTNWNNGGHVTGWRFDWCSVWGVNMEFDYIRLGAGTAIDQGASIVVSPSVATNYYAVRSGYCNTTACAGATVSISPAVGNPVFALGSTSSHCSKAETVTYGATATNTSGITYTLDAASLAAGNTIVAGTGAVTYTAAWHGTSIITASAAGCSGPKTATHTVTVNETPSAVNITPSTKAMCSNDIQELVASGGNVSSGINTLLDENFNGPNNPPTGWSKINNSYGGNPALADWTLDPDGFSYYGTWHSNDNSQFYISNSDAQGSNGTTSTILVSKSFSTLGFTTASVSFYHYFYSGDALTAGVDYSTDGSNWTNLKTYINDIGSPDGFIQDNASLPVGEPIVYVRFTLDGDYGYFWAIDNVKVIGNSPNTPITWTPVAGLYTNPGATAAYVLNTPAYNVYAHPTISTIYTATATSPNGCKTEGTAEITVTTLPIATFSYAGTPYCSNATNPLPSLDGAAGTFTAGPGLSINAASGLVSLTGSTAGTYTVTNTIDPLGACPEVIATNSIQITTVPSAIISYSGTPFCKTVSSAPVTINGTGTYTGGAFTALPSGLSIDPGTGEINPGLSLAGNYTVTYTIPAIGGGCGPIEVTTQVTITALPIAGFSYTGTPYCSNASNPLPEFVLGGLAGTFTVTPGDLIFVSNTTGEVNIAGSSPASYTITNTIAAAGGCAEVTATTPFTINASPTATITYTGSPWCISAGVQSVIQTGNLGGAYTAAPSGLTIDPFTGEINPGSSLAGTYTVTYTVSVAGCAASYEATASVTITALPVATFSYTGSPYNPTGTALPTLDGAAGVFSSTPGLVFVSSANGEVDLSASTGGVHTVTNTIAAAGGCAEETATSLIEIIIPTTKTLSLKAFIEGLYIGGGMMHEALDFDDVTQDFPMKWGVGIADKVTVTLYDDTYSNIIASYPGVDLNTYGSISIEVSSTLVDSYYITILPRNSVPITTALPHSFAGSSISYDFSNAVDQAYGVLAGGVPQKDLGDGYFGMYSGELDHDSYFAIDGSDVSVLDPDILIGPYGYLLTDLNGDGVVDGSDMSVMDANSLFGPLFWNPTVAKKKVLLLNQHK